MLRSAKQSVRGGTGFANNRGFLLVEATLTAVVIGVGLVFISRGLATNVKQLSTLQQYDRLLQLADTTFTELEAQAQQTPPLTTLAGEYASPNEAYQWALEAHLFDVEGLQPQTMEQVSVTVSRRDSRPPVVRLRTVWPSAWIRAE